MNLPKQANLVLDHRYFLGSLRDYSGNANSGIGTGIYFQKKPDKHVIFEGTDLITVADSAELQLTEGTLIPYGDFDKFTASDRLISKRDVGGINYDLYLASLTVLKEGDSTATATINWEGAKSIAMSFIAGSKAKGYKDGVFVSDFSAAWTPTVNDAPLIIGNLYSGVNPQGNPLKGVLIYNTVLTDEEIAQAHAWIMATVTPSYPKKNFIYPSQINPKATGLVAGYDMKSIHGKIIDLTNNANNGTITGATQSKGIGGIDALDFNGIDNKVIVADDDSLDFTNSITVSFWMKKHTSWVNNESFIAKGDAEGATNYRVITSAAAVEFSFYNAGWFSQTWTRPTLEKWNHYVCTYDKVNMITYLNGVLINSSAETTAMVANAGALKMGTRTTEDSSYFANASMAEVKLLNYAQTQAEITADYNKYAKMPYFLDDLKDANESIAAEGGAVGTHLSNTEWKFGDTSARYKISRESTTNMIGGSQLLVDGDMEAVGVADWTVVSGVISKSTVNPHSGAQSLKLSYNSPTDCYFSQDIGSVVGKRYKFTGWMKGDGTSYPQLHTGGSVIYSGSSSTDWQYVEVIYTALYPSIYFYARGGTTGNYVEFDDVTVLEIDNNDKVIECTTAGLLYQEMQQAYGTWEWDLYKGANGNYSNIMFMADTIGAFNATGQDGYLMQFDINEAFPFFRIVNGGFTLLANSGNSYIDNNTWYKIRFTRRYDGQFTIYIKGGAFTAWTLVVVSSGTNPVTDNTIINSKYIVVDLDAGDMITDFRLTQGVIAP